MVYQREFVVLSVCAPLEVLGPVVRPVEVPVIHRRFVLRVREEGLRDYSVHVHLDGLPVLAEVDLFIACDFVCGLREDLPVSPDLSVRARLVVRKARNLSPVHSSVSFWSDTSFSA